jgi:hypothetical protein
MYDRKRRALGNIDESWTAKRSESSRLSLMKMAHATQTFWTQAEALEFISKRQSQTHRVRYSRQDRFHGQILSIFG